MKDFMTSFVEEASALLSHLEIDLLTLEKEPENKEVLNNIFRVMHTLKGTAGMCGFINIQDLAHEFEGIFDQIREGKLVINSEIIDFTLKGKDVILAILKNENSENFNNALIESLHEMSQVGSLHEMNETSDKPLKELTGLSVFAIFFSPDKAIFERGLDPDKTVAELKDSGKSNIILHENKQSWKVQKTQKICLTTWEIYLSSTALLNEIEENFLFYEPDEYRIYDISSGAEQVPPELLARLQKLYNKPDVKEHLRECLIPLNVEASKAITQLPENTDEKLPEGFPSNTSTEGEMTINVSSVKLDELMNLVSELVTQTAILEARATYLKDPGLNNAAENLEKLTKRFRTNALDLRLVPVGALLSRFKRQVRDLSKKLNKHVNFFIEGQDIEIDKTILKSVENPLVHIIRNSIDHGIEFPEERIQVGKKKDGLLKISAFNAGVIVIIQVQDDGRGIDLEKVREAAIKKGYIQQDQAIMDNDLINLILEPGFTTSDNISLVSGRGVGMDVVRKELNAVGGTIEIFTEKNLGTTITLKLPTTLTIIDTLMIEVNQSIVLIPMLDIEFCYKEKSKEILKRDNKYIQYKNKPIPFVSLREKFRYPANDANDIMVIILNKFDKSYAIIADRIIGEYQAVIKPLGDLFNSQPYFSGGSIMVDGKLALILDTSFLFTQITKN